MHTKTSSVPAIDGLQLRNLQSELDFAGMAFIREACREYDQIDETTGFDSTPSADQIAESFKLSNPQDVLIVELHNKIIGYCHFFSWREADGTWVYVHVGWLIPEQRGRGIGTSMVGWAEERIREIAQQAHPNEKWEFGGNASSTEKESTALLLGAGYYVAFTMMVLEFDITRPVPNHALPNGFELRPVAPDHLLEIATSIYESYHGEFDSGRFSYIPVDEAEGIEDTLSWLSKLGHDHSLWQVAWVTGLHRVAGVVISSVEDGVGHVMELTVRPVYRRRKLGRFLLADAVKRLVNCGVSQIRLNTTKEFKTRAIDLYESVGFHTVKEFPRYRKPSA